MPASKCLILSAHDGLIDRRIVGQANALALSGRDVTLVSVPAAGLESLLPQVRIIAPPAAPRSVPAGTLRGFARRLPAPVKSSLRSLAWRLGAAPLRRFTDYFQQATPPGAYDVIHCHDLQTLPSGVRLRTLLAPAARIIYDSHELFPCQFPPGRRRRYWGAIEAEHIGCADAVITVNESIASALAQRYAPSSLLVLYNSCHLAVAPVSTPAFHRHFGLPDEAPRDAFKIIFQGGFTREKNVEALAQACAALGSAYQLFLLGGGVGGGGGGGVEPRLRHLAARNPSHNIHFGAWVDAEQLLGYVAHADAGIIPYLDADLPNNHLCTPNKLFEYMQAGIPICAGDLPELRRVVQDEKLGRVYVMHTAPEIAAALADFAPRCRAGEFTPHAFAAARDKYSWSRQTDKLLHLYQQLGV